MPYNVVMHLLTIRRAKIVRIVVFSSLGDYACVVSVSIDAS